MAPIALAIGLVNAVLIMTRPAIERSHSISPVFQRSTHISIPAMKSLSIHAASLALALAGFAFAPAASAADYGYWATAAPAKTISSYRSVGYCAPVYVCTKELSRAKVCRYAYDSCGKKYSYHVTVVTYANYYSDGSFKTFTKTYRA